MLVIGNSEAWWQPWPRLGRPKVQLYRSDYVNSMPVPEHQLNLKRNLFSLVKMSGGLDEVLIAVPKGDVHLVERWFRLGHHD